MRPSGFLRRKRTGWNRSWSSNERCELLPVSLPAHVVGVVVARTLDHHKLHRTAGRGGDVAPHCDRDEHVGRAMKDQDRTPNAPDAVEIIQAQPDQEAREDAVMAGGHAAGTRERRLE